MKVFSYILIAFALLISCNKRERFDGPNSYMDGFETYADVEELLDGDDQRWSFFQITKAFNELSIDTSIVHSGTQSLKFVAAPNDDEVSKCSINKQHMAFWEGETVDVNFWCYLVGNAAVDWMFLFDLEEKIPVGAGPGIRLAIVNNQLLVEHKYPMPNIVQSNGGMDFPRDQWVHIRFQARLSRKDEGMVRVWQDDQLILEANNWQTLPKDILYAQQGTKGMYNQIEFGITANADDNPHELYLDDVNVVTYE
jgi:hypothetical protein